MRTFAIVTLGTLLGLFVGTGLEIAVASVALAPIIMFGCALVGAGFGVAVATRTRKAPRQITQERYPNRIVSRTR